MGLAYHQAGLALIQARLISGFSTRMGNKGGLRVEGGWCHVTGTLRVAWARRSYRGHVESVHVRGTLVGQACIHPQLPCTCKCLSDPIFWI